MLKGNLNAKDNAYVPHVYTRNLNQLINDPNIKNIAVTAPYDSGKTTILKSYFKKRERTYKKYINLENKLIEIINKFKRKWFLSPNLLSPIRDYEFINIPNFFYVKGKIKDLKDDKKNIADEEITENNINKSNEIQLEKSVIEQLLFKPNTKKYPDSDLKRLKVHSFHSVLINFIYFIFIIGYFLRIFENSGKLNWWNSLSIWNNFYFQFISLIVIIFGSFNLFKSLTHTISNFKLRLTTKIGPLELTEQGKEKENYSVDLFNYYGDELQYYFKKSNIKVVVFEDLDRFDEPLIFQKLRELNQNLNQSGNNITFIYSLKDKIFSLKDSETSAAALKTKFFDFVMPIFPIHSYRDSSKILIHESYKYGLTTEDNDVEKYFLERDEELNKKKNIKINSKYLRGIGLYISDTREIKNIISETYFYLSELPLKMFDPKMGGNSNAINKLLAIIVYKNEFPDDFDKLASGRKSKLENFINHINNLKGDFLNLKTKENNAKIKKLNTKIEKLESKLTSDIKTLMAIRFQELFGKNKSLSLKINNQYFDLNASDEEIYEFWEKAFKNHLQYKTNYTNYDQQITELDEVEQELFQSYLLDGTCSNQILSKWKKSKEKLEDDNAHLRKSTFNLKIKDLVAKCEDNKNIFQGNEKIQSVKNIRFITQNPILKYLVLQGLIDFDYTDYISPDPYNLTNIEEQFVRLVNNHEEINNFGDFRLSRPERVVREIDLLDDSVGTYKYAYSPDILSYFVTVDSKSKYVDALIESAHDKKQPEFVLIAIENLTEKNYELSILYESILKTWKTYYKDLFSSDNENLKIRLTEQLLDYLADCEKNSDVFSSLKDQKIFEEKQFKDELLLLGIDKLNRILKSKQKYPYPDLSFASKGSVQKLSALVFYKWYEENENNFKIIFNKFANHKLNLLLDKFVDKLNLSDDFIKKNIYVYYKNEKNASYDDLKTLIEFTDDKNSLNNLKVLSVYLNTENNFDDQTKRKLLLNDLQLVSLISEKQFSDDQILQGLLNENKLIYDKKILDALSNNYNDFAIKYAIKFESKNNVSEIYNHKDWSFRLSYLENTKLVKELVELIDKSSNEEEPNIGWSNNRISNKALKLLANNTNSIIVMKELIKLPNSDDIEVKKIILKNLFSKQVFRSKFTKEEISQFIFNDSEFIGLWTIDGQNEVSTKQLRKKYEKELSLLQKVIPQKFKKKGTNKFIFRKSLDEWFR